MDPLSAFVFNFVITLLIVAHPFLALALVAYLVIGTLIVLPCMAISDARARAAARGPQYPGNGIPFAIIVTVLTVGMMALAIHISSGYPH
jgi:hypothetical protein